MKWVTDIEETQGHKVTYPMIGDPELKIAKLYGMLPTERRQLRGAHGIGQCRRAHGIRRRSGQNNQAAAQLPDEYRPPLIRCSSRTGTKVAPPANWKQGDEVIILPAVSNQEGQKKYPEGWKAPRPYLRIVKQPK